jgi:FkbH-like protein
MQSEDADEFKFDEAWYLASNKDVALAVAQGRGASGLQHYLLYGKKEGRLPLPPEGWRNRKSESAILAAALQSAEKQIDRRTDDPSLAGLHEKHNGAHFRNPIELARTEIAPRRLVFVGSCLFESYGFHRGNPSGAPADFVLVNHGSEMPAEAAPGVPITDYELCVVQLPLRSIYNDTMLTGLDHGSVEYHQRAFDRACRNLAFQLDCRMAWNKQYGLLTFVLNFLVPQKNPMGILFPKYDLRNPEYFIWKLNEHLEERVRSYRNAYVLDNDGISASVGKRYFQDDLIVQISHGALMGAAGTVTNRAEPLAPVSAHFETGPRQMFVDAIWAEIVAMLRVVRQTDSVKLVVTDLDDTLWHGVSGDMTDVGPHMLEGWPRGVMEALSYLKKRGILLAIISKNEESRIREIWPKIFGQGLNLSDFAAVMINWRSKAENMQELLHGVNLLPRSVVFIDDSPAERAAMAQAFPDMRIIGRQPYYLRSTLLWSTETQVVALTEEATKRTEMVRAQLQREELRAQLTREDFLRAAAPRVHMMAIERADHPRFARAFELINKTNQYNTTGKRWTEEEIVEFLKSGGEIHAFDAEDAYTPYGLVGVVLIRENNIVQWVMSCRVLGFRIEDAVMSYLVERMRKIAATAISGRLVETDVNFPCRTLFSDSGFTQDGETWTLPPEQSVEAPPHVKMLEAGAD